MKVDHSYVNFIRQQQAAAAELTATTNRLRLIAEPGVERPRAWLAEFDCTTLVRRPGGAIEFADKCAVAIRFPQDYLSRADSFEVLSWFGPEFPFHPNVHPTARLLCAGQLKPAMSLEELLFQIHQVVTWRNVTLVESDALNPDACAWARSNPDRYPFDNGPLRGDAARFGGRVDRGNPR